MSDIRDISPRHVLPFGDTTLTLTTRQIIEHERLMEAFALHLEKAASARSTEPVARARRPLPARDGRVTLRTATALLWPVLQIGRLFVALSTVTASPSQPRKAIADAMLVAGSAFTNAGWLWALNLCGEQRDDDL